VRAAIATAALVAILTLTLAPIADAHRCPPSTAYSGAFPAFTHIRTNVRCRTVRLVERAVQAYWRHHHRFPRRFYAAHRTWRARYAHTFNSYGDPVLSARFTARSGWIRASLGA
jgi:hypothetical protein